MGRRSGCGGAPTPPGHSRFDRCGSDSGGLMTNVQDWLSTYTPAPLVRILHPAWARTASIYQINTRQFTAEGTFRAAQAHLPRLRELGVSILWLMPVQEIGRKNRKGTLGSPYAVRDYYAVAEELGTMQDLQDFVAA